MRCALTRAAGLSLGLFGFFACGADSDPSIDDVPPDAAPADATVSCEGDQFRHARAPKTLWDGLTAVPIDVLEVEARFVFDMSEGTGNGTATMNFALGDEAGSPAFDLRQTLDYVELNGESIHPADVGFHDFYAADSLSGLRVANVVLEPCTANELYVEYPIEEPWAGRATPPVFEAGELTWGFAHSDLWPGRLVEQWLPAYLMYDQFRLTVEVEVLGTATPHTLISNGAIEAIGARHWQVRFPDHFTSLSPMLVVVPTGQIEQSVETVELPEGGAVDIELTRHVRGGGNLPDLHALLRDAFLDFHTHDGPYPHGDRLVAYIWPEDTGMEYDGAFTSSSDPVVVVHELYHSWHGRGLKPAVHPDAWFDEAWTVYRTSPPEEPLDFSEAPVVLSSSDPWHRYCPEESYEEGARLMLALADLIGAEQLIDLNRELLATHTLGFVTTPEIERLYTCGADEPEVRRWFHRFVYGRDGEPDPAPDDYCN